MVNIQQETVSKEKTVKQIVLVNNLLQSRYFSKREFEKYKTLELKVIKNSYEEGLLISLLIAQLRFRKKFSSKRSKAHLKCIICGSKKELQRLFNPAGNKQHVVCFTCEDKRNELYEEACGLHTEIRKADERVELAIDERNEASADLYRKYEYPGGDVDVKIDTDKAKQDYDFEVKAVEELAYKDKTISEENGNRN